MSNSIVACLAPQGCFHAVHQSPRGASTVEGVTILEHDGTTSGQWPEIDKPAGSACSASHTLSSSSVPVQSYTPAQLQICRGQDGEWRERVGRYVFP